MIPSFLPPCALEIMEHNGFVSIIATLLPVFSTKYDLWKKKEAIELLPLIVHDKSLRLHNVRKPTNIGSK